MRAKPETRKTGFSLTNRGLSIEFDLLPISYDTFVALLNCVYTEASKPEQLVGIYLRQVSSSQFDRVRWGSCGCRWIGPPNQILSSKCFKMENAYISSRVSSREPCINQVQFPKKGLKFRDTRAYRALVSLASVSYRGSWNVDRGLIELPIDYQGALLTFYIPDHKKAIQLLQIGFDEDFHPVCLVVDRTHRSTKLPNEGGLRESFEGMFDYRSIGWIVPKAKDGSVISFHRNVTGLWAIKGDRESGLHCNLTDQTGNKGLATWIELKVNRIKSGRDELVGDRASEIWELEIINLLGM